jgi:hypothetical protein
MALDISGNVIFVDQKAVFWAPLKVEIALEEGPRIFLLFDGYQCDGKKASLFPCNVLCLDRKGRIMWKAEGAPGKGKNSYTDLRLEGGKLIGYAFNEAVVELDKQNGRISEARYVPS